MDIQWIHFLINNQSYTIFLISIQLKEPVTLRVDREPANGASRQNKQPLNVLFVHTCKCIHSPAPKHNI